jgi:hypothetical protein
MAYLPRDKENQMNIKLLGAVTAVAGVLATAAIAPVMAHENTLQKMGKAIQYSTRKQAENVSDTAHRVVHENSVHHVRNHHYKYILTPAGDHVWLHHHYHHKKTM